MDDDQLKVTLKMLNYNYDLNFDDINIYLKSNDDDLVLMDILNNNQYTYIKYNYFIDTIMLNVLLKRKMKIGDIICAKR
jgi:hypothetical protein